MSDNKQELFSHRIHAGRRTYFFDVKEGSDGIKHLVITETRHSDGDRERSRVMVFEEHFEEFFGCLKEITEFLGLNKSETTDRLEEIRQTHPNAYKKWTPEEDAQLKESYTQGLGIDALAETFQRQSSAIRSRLTKLGVLSNTKL